MPLSTDSETGGDPLLERLREALTGRVILPDDADWDAVRTPWNVAVRQDPAAVAFVADDADVREAVRWAAAHGRSVTAQPVGHGAGSDLEGVLLLRTGALDAIEIDLEAGTARVGAGVRMGALLARLEATGLTFLAGSSPDPTVVGMALGGGLSWFGRLHGLSSEAIVSVDLVDASGRPRHVTVDEDPELFWALRGGGGDFGVVTALEVRLFPADHLVGGRMFWPIEQMPSVLRAFREATATAPPELSLWYYTYRFPPLPEVPEPMRGKSFSAVAAAALGPGQPGSAELARLRAVPGLVADTTAPMPLSLLGNIVAEPIDPTPAMVHSMLLDDLDDGLIENLTSAVGADSGSPLAAVQIRHLGAALARSGPNPGAGGTVDSPYVLFALGVVAMPALVEPITATFARIDEAVAGHTDGRTVPNLLAVGDDIGRAWPAEVRRRLAEIKARVDPHGTIVSNHPVGAPSDGWQGRVEVGDGRSTYG